MRIGVIALQGDVSEHVSAMELALAGSGRGGEVIEVRRAGVVPTCDALVIPGGESTTLGRLMQNSGIGREIKSARIPVLGTCAGMVLLAKAGNSLAAGGQHLLGLMDIAVNRNAFGRQRESFEAALEVKGFRKAFNAVFIRAPAVTKCGKNVEVLARHGNFVVAARQENLLALAFHPELTDDLRLHNYFLEVCIGKKQSAMSAARKPSVVT